VIILDVGHGNAAIARSEDFTMLIDAPSDPTLLFVVRELGIEHFDSIVISHRDRDHVAGLPAVLSNPSLGIGQVFVPADATKNTQSHQSKALIGALADAKRSGRAQVSRDLDDAMDDVLSGGCFNVEVLGPLFEDAMSGPGGSTQAGNRISSNTASAVIRISCEGGGSILLAGDADRTSFQALADRKVDLSADILVFPHHGRNASVGDEREFARWISSLVSPSQVYFSVGRGVISRPSPEVVIGLREACPEAYIACTQLCRECAPPPLDEGRSSTHLGDLPSSGAAAGDSCAGTIRVALGGPILTNPDPNAHQSFIDDFTSAPMCRRPLVDA
jgi:beta-lactamase superfamily II metal-dependent hydrolase